MSISPGMQRKSVADATSVLNIVSGAHYVYYSSGSLYYDGGLISGVASYTWADFIAGGFDLTVARHVHITDKHSSITSYGGSLWYVDPTAPVGYKRQLVSGPIACTWATRPDAATYPGIVIKVSDYRYAEYYSNGTDYMPVSPQLIYHATFGTVSSPTCTLTGVTSGKFTIPGGAPTVPANMLTASSRLRIRAVYNKTNANAAFTANMYFGTSGDNTDLTMHGQASSSTANNAYMIASPALNFISTSALITTYNGSEGGGGSAGSIIDKASHIAIGSAMMLSFYVTAMNAADIVALQTLNIWHEA